MRWYERISGHSVHATSNAASLDDSVLDDMSDRGGNESRGGLRLQRISAILESAGLRKALELLAGVTLDEESMESLSNGRPNSARLTLGAVYAFNLMPERALQVLGNVDRVRNPGTWAAITGLKAFCFALIGNVGEAEKLSLAAELRLKNAGSRDRSSALAPALAARALLAFEVGDESALFNAVQSSFGLQIRSELGRSGVRAMAILPKVLAGGTSPTDEYILDLSRGDDWSPPGSRFGAYLKWVQSIDYIQKGVPGYAISTSLECFEFPDHMVCLHSTRAAAWLALGQEQLARAQLANCLHLRNDHNARTAGAARMLAALTLRSRDRRRAEQLARTIKKTGGPDRSILWRLLPSQIIAEAVDLFPDSIDPGVQGAREAVDVSYRKVAMLSEREFLVLCLLHLQAPLEDLASLLNVSKNTIGSQAQSLYRKLGVRSRLEATEVARTLGLDAKVAEYALAIRRHRVR